MTTTTDTSAMTLAQKSDRILAQTRGLSGATPNATRLIEELRLALESNRNDVQRLTAERDEARLQTGRILTEIDCRIEHGAESNGHLEGIRNLFKNKK